MFCIVLKVRMIQLLVFLYKFVVPNNWLTCIVYYHVLVIHKEYSKVHFDVESIFDSLSLDKKKKKILVLDDIRFTYQTIKIFWLYKTYFFLFPKSWSNSNISLDVHSAQRKIKATGIHLNSWFILQMCSESYMRVGRIKEAVEIMRRNGF